MTVIPVFSEAAVGSGGRTIGLKLRQADDGDYVPLVAFDSEISISTVDLNSGSNTIGGVYTTPSALSQFSILPGASSALEGSHILKASAGNLYSLYMITTTVAGYLMTFDSTTVPSDGAVTPIEYIPVPANGLVSIDFAGSPPDHYSTGIVVVFSSTGPFTKLESSTVYFKWRVK